MSDIAFGANRESAVLLRAALFVLLYPILNTEAKLRRYRGDGCGPAKRRGLWKRKGCRTMHLAKNPSLFKACAAPFAKTARFAQAAAPAFAFCPSGSPTAAPPVLPQDVSPSCETFSRRLASWRTCIRRAGRVHIGARKISKSGVLSVDGPRGNLSGRRKRRSAKSRRCEAGCPVGELPSGGGMSSEDAFRRPDGRRTAGEFCRNTQVKREVIHLSTRLSTMSGFYAVKKPQKRAGKERTGKGAFPRGRTLI